MEKENVLQDFKKMIYDSWTYEKLTNFERQQLEKTLESVQLNNVLKGTLKQRWAILQAIYNAFLMGVGYTDFNWRDDNTRIRVATNEQNN